MAREAVATMQRGYAGAITKTRSDSFLLIVSFILHFLVKMPMGFDVSRTWAADIIFLVFIWFIFWGPEMRTKENLTSLFLVLLLSVGLPLFAATLFYFDAGNFFSRVLSFSILNPWLTPWWVYYFALTGNENEKLIRVSKLVIVFFWLIYILGLLATQGYFANLYSRAATLEQKEQAADIFGQVSSDVLKFFNQGYRLVSYEIPNKIRTGFVEPSIAKATGGFYSGQTTEEQKGIYFKRIRSPPKIYACGTNVFDAELVSVGLDKDTEIKVDCGSDLGGVATPGSFELRKDGVNSVSCTFNIQPCTPETELEVDDRIVFNAIYDFETTASLELAFVDEDVRRAAEQQRELGTGSAGSAGPTEQITASYTKKAVNTDSPVVIGVSEITQPIGLKRGADRNYEDTFGMTLNNNWKSSISFSSKGKIGKISSLEVIAPGSVVNKQPKGFVLSNCYPGAVARDLGNGEISYTFPELERIAGEDIEEFVTVNCKVVIEPSDETTRSILLQNKVGVVKQTVVIKTKYTYETEIDTRIDKIEKGEAGGTRVPTEFI